MTTTRIHLVPRPPFKLSSVVQSHGWVQLAPFQTDKRRLDFRYVDQLASGLVVEYHVEEADTARVSAAASRKLGTGDRLEISQRVRWMLNLDLNLDEFYEAAGQESKLAGVADAGRGRFLRSPTLWEDVVKTILTTNVTWAGTVAMVRALVGALGEPSTISPGRAFPTPACIAASTAAELAATARLGYRAPYIHELACRIAAGEIDLESFRDPSLPTEELRRRLRSLKGVGPYAAASLMTLLGRYDFIPVDSWALTLVSHEWHGGNRVKPAEVEPHFAQWGKWKALAYWLWDWDYLKRGGE